MKSDRRKSLPGVKSSNILDGLRESVQTYLGLQGDKLDRGVTLRDLANAGLIDVSKVYLAGGSADPIGRVKTIIGEPGPGGTIVFPGTEIEPDLTPPPTPTGFTATPGLAYITIECDGQIYTQGHGHGVTNVYGVTLAEGDPEPTFADAVLLTSFSGNVHSYATNPNTKWALWIKWKTKDGVESAAPAGGINGLQVTTGQNVTTLLEALDNAARDPAAPYSRVSYRAALFYVTGEDDEEGTNLFSVVTVPITNGGVTVPPGVYMKAAFIMNGTITNLMVANAAIDNLKIANVSASKLITGTISVGESISSMGYVAGVSGWRINGAGNVEFNNAVLRGSAYVGGGTVGGIVITPNYVQSSNYDGAGNGFRLSADGTLDLPGGSVNAQQLNVGAGGNLLNDSVWVDRGGWYNAIPVGWEVWNAEAVGSAMVVPGGGYQDWIPAGLNGLALYNGQGPHTGGTMGLWTRFAVIPGRRYEGSIYSGAHRCRVWTDFEWHNEAGAVIGYSSDMQIVNTQEKAGGKSLDKYKRIGHFGVAPASAAYGVFRAVKESTLVGNDSYAFLVQPYVGHASTKQTAFSPYSPSGLGSRVTPLGISTPNLQALSAVLGDVYAGSLRGGSYGGGYNWPSDGGMGFYLGPGGLLIGNGSVPGRGFFQIEDWSGNLYMPGLRVQNARLYIDQGDVINTLNIAGGAVASSYWARGVNSAAVGINVPAGQVHRVHLTASWQGRLWDVGPAQPIGIQGASFRLTNVPDQFAAAVRFQSSVSGGGGETGEFFYNYAYAVPPIAMTSLIDLGPGYHTLSCDSWGAPVNCEVTLVANVMRRP